jgi:hypothetical protein
MDTVPVHFYNNSSKHNNGSYYLKFTLISGMVSILTSLLS